MPEVESDDAASDSSYTHVKEIVQELLDDSAIKMPRQELSGIDEQFVLDTLKKHEEQKTAAVVNKYMMKPPYRRQSLYAPNKMNGEFEQRKPTLLNRLEKILKKAAHKHDMPIYSKTRIQPDPQLQRDRSGSQRHLEAKASVRSEISKIYNRTSTSIMPHLGKEISELEVDTEKIKERLSHLKRD